MTAYDPHRNGVEENPLRSTLKDATRKALFRVQEQDGTPQAHQAHPQRCYTRWQPTLRQLQTGPKRTAHLHDHWHKTTHTSFCLSFDNS
jgi:hypothetical protein